jgi:hypothetical protein
MDHLTLVWHNIGEWDDNGHPAQQTGKNTDTYPGLGLKISVKQSSRLDIW